MSQLVDGRGIVAGNVPQLTSWIVVIQTSLEFAFLAFHSPLKEFTLHSGDAARGRATAAFNSMGRPLDEDSRRAHDWYVLTCEKPTMGKDIVIELAVDTGNDLFLKACQDGEKDSLTVECRIVVIGHMQNNEVRASTHPTTLLVNIPIARLEPYHGVLAIDFGNTNSTLVARGEGGGNGILVQCDSRVMKQCPPLAFNLAMEAAKPVPTIVEIHDRVEGKDGVANYVGAYGVAAIRAKYPLAGAKRMLSDVPKQESKDQKLAIVVGDALMRVPAHEPAEFFISKLFEAFLFYFKKVPTRVALTCPSAFTESEANRLRGTAVNALRRALREAPLSLEAASDPKNKSGPVRAVLDEATAAAFHFVDREVLRRLHGVSEFTYLFPQGMNILIYDCGGGTTDISLVRICQPCDAEGVVRDNELNVDVLGRVGHRTFGGDFITRQYCRLLRFEIARAKEPFRRPESGVSEDLERRERSGDLDRFCPTRFERDAPNSADVARRRRLASHLWRFAEHIKTLPPEKDLREAGFVKDFLDETVDETGMKVGKLLDIGEDAIKRPDESWLEELILPAIDETIHYANQLLASAMQASDGSTGEVHRVFVVGNASRFPMIRRRMTDAEHGLRVRFLEERLRDVHHGLEAEELKNCVAQGAALSLEIARHGQLQIKWDENVMSKLAFDIVHKSEANVYARVVFDMGKQMDCLGTAEVTISEGAGRADLRPDRIFLHRRWPGESEPEKYLVFRFERPMEVGKYLISYDKKAGLFRACSERHKEICAWGEPEVPPPYVAPAQSGEI